MKRLYDLYLSVCHEPPLSIDRIAAGAGSNRAYYRLKGASARSMIGVVGTSEEENAAFVYLAQHFLEKHLNVPEVYAVSSDGLCYLQQDLGSRSLYDALRQGRERGGEYGEEEKALIRKVILYLPRLQFTGAEGLDYSRCYPHAALDGESIGFDLNYFKYCFLKATGIEFNESRLEDDFRCLTRDIADETLCGFMYRDFQARNVMLSDDDEPFFIDFQGGRHGPCYYDLVAFLWQASARYSDELRATLIGDYYEELAKYDVALPARETFDSRLLLFVLFRTLQVLGAYGFRGYFERKPYFINSIIPAVENLRRLLEKVDFPYPYLTDILRRMTALEKYKQPSVATDDGRLVVKVWSFAYKYGIPADDTGHGGGYVFDCRSTHNPGRYPQFQQMTGLDGPVVEFLEEDGEILTFLENIYYLADHHVKRYMERGFTSLSFAFGCTGGRHRSVYAAEQLALHIHEKYGVEVVVCHREQGINKVLR